MSYRKKTSRQYSQLRQNRLVKTQVHPRKTAVSTLSTGKWGRIHYPKGSHPLLVEVETDGFTTQIEGLGYRAESDLHQIQKAMEKKGRNELPKDQKASVTIHFPKQKRKPVRFTVVGEQPLKPRVIHHRGWPPPHLVEEIKAEWKKKPDRKTATDLEAMTYLQTASMATPFNDQYYRIFFHLTRNYLKGKGWKKFEGDMDFLDLYKSLSKNDRRELQRLKDWIWKQQQKDLEERRKQAGKLMVKCPGGKIRSSGKGRGEGYGKGKGPMGVPKG